MTPGVSVRRTAVAVVVLAAALFAAVVLQLTVVNRLPLPAASQFGAGQHSVSDYGGSTPDLVLLLVAAIAISTTPAVAAIAGFAGGLALDVAPPAAHYAGEYALIFCLVCYAAARVYRATTETTGEHDALMAFTIMAVAVAAGEAGKAGLGLLLADPSVTAATVGRVLPGAILYDLLLAPLAFWLVTWVARGRVFWHSRPLSALAQEPSREQRLRPAFREPAFRQASAGAAPKLRLAGTGADYASPGPARRVPGLRLTGTGKNYLARPVAGLVPRLRLAGTGKDYLARPVAGRVPSLRLAGTGKDYLARPVAGLVPRLRLSDARKGAARRGPAPLAGHRRRKPSFGGDLPVRPPRVLRTPGKNWLADAASPALGAAAGRPGRGQPGRGWLAGAGAGALAGGGQRPSKLAGVRIGRRMGDVVNRGATPGSQPWVARGRRRARPLRFTRAAPRAARPAASIAPPARRSAAEAFAARSAPSGLSALSGAGTPLAGGRSPKPGWLSGSRGAATPAAARTPRSGWLGSARGRPRTVIGSTVAGRTVTGAGPGMRKGAFRRRRPGGGNWYASSPSGAWLRRRPRRSCGYLLAGGTPHGHPVKRLLVMIGVGR